MFPYDYTFSTDERILGKEEEQLSKLSGLGSQLGRLSQ